MEHQLWTTIVALIDELGQGHFHPGDTYDDTTIAQVYYWAVIHDRPTTWALHRSHWPLHLRRGLRLPSDSTMSRRLRRPSVGHLLTQLEHRVVRPQTPGLFWIIDGKSLPIGGCSKDRQAGYGRAAGGKAKGYKVHAVINPCGQLAAWRLAPMNTDERVMAPRLLRESHVQGYVVADSNYDSNPLHAVCDQLGELQLLARRRHGPGHGLGRHRHSAGRLRAVARIENPFPAFAEGLLHDRAAIERVFGRWVSWGGGLSPLPAWVRTHRRVRRWVQAKLVLNTLKRQLPTRTYAA